MFVKLDTLYDQKSEASVHVLQQKFYSFTFERAESTPTNVTKL